MTRTATATDLDAVIAVQHRAFSRVARELDIDPVRLPPMSETASDLAHHINDGSLIVVSLAENHSIVGAVRGTPTGDRVEIGRLVVDDGYEGRGIASALMDAIESSFPDADVFELFTGADAERSLRLYTKRGYQEFRRGLIGGVEMIWLEKRRSPTVCCDHD